MSDNPTSKTVALLICTMASFVTPFMGSAINIALPAIGEEFSVDAVVLGWVATSFLVAAAMSLVPLGKLADIHGRKRIFTYGLWLYTLASFLCAVPASVGLLIGFRVLQGIGGAMIFGTSVAILTSVFPVGERGRALGTNAAAVYLGLSLGPFLGGLLTHAFGWRSVFLANVPLGLIAIALVYWRLKGEWAEARGEKLDTAGSIIFAIGLVGVMYGFSRLPEITGVWVTLIGLLAIVAFVRWESRVDNPVLNTDLFRRNTVFAFSNLAALINYSATFALTFLLSLYLQYIKGLGPDGAGRVLVAQPVVMAVFSPLAGRLSDRIEPRIVASAGMGLAAIGLALLSALGQGTSIAFIVASLALLGFGFALFSSPNTNAVMSSVERRFLGVASATLGTMRLVGQTLSMGVATLIIALFIGRAQILPENYAPFVSAVRTAFVVFALLCFGGVFASLARGNARPR